MCEREQVCERRHGERHAMMVTRRQAEDRQEREAGAQGGGEAMRCLLVHGFNGEPMDMCQLEDRLGAEGFATRNLLLPGHGTSPRDFAAHGWDDWLGHVLSETRAALARGERVVLIGHSMGAGVSLAVAAQETQVAGVVALCPPLRLNARVRRLVALTHRVMPYIPSWGEDVRDRRGARDRYTRRAYRLTATATIHDLFSALPRLEAALPDVRCPALIVCARHDHVVPARDGIATHQLIGSREKDLLVLERSYHAVTKDVERHVVFERVVRFCQRIGSGTGQMGQNGAPA
jgi:carboxylesterase